MTTPLFRSVYLEQKAEIAQNKLEVKNKGNDAGLSCYTDGLGILGFGYALKINHQNIVYLTDCNDAVR
jgi:hypothetical protein